jgi:hypothetical protein
MKRLINAVLVTLIVACLFTCYAHAADIDATLQTVSGSVYLDDLCSQANDAVGVEILYYDSGSGLLRFSNRLYHGLSYDDKVEFMEFALSYISKLPDTASAKMKNSVYKFISQQDTAVTAAMKYLQENAGADLVEAETWFKSLTSIIGLILGLLCIFIFLFLGFSILFDIFYLVIPPFQALLDVSSGISNKRPWGVSREAWASMQDAEKSSDYKNVLSLYFKRRSSVIIIVSLAITYLVSGKIYDVIVWLIEAFSV